MLANNQNTAPAIRHPYSRHMAIEKYSNLASTHIFYPFAIETAGTWHEMAIELTQEIDSRITTITEDTRERQHSFSNAFPWLCKEEMRLLSTTPW